MKGLVLGTTKTVPVGREVANAVTAHPYVSFIANRKNEEKRAEKEEDKNINTLFPGSKLIKLGKICYVPPEESADNALPTLYLLLTNKKNNNSNQSIIQQATDGIGVDLKIIVLVIPLSASTAVLSLQFSGIDVSNLGLGILPMGFVPPGAA